MKKSLRAALFHLRGIGLLGGIGILLAVGAIAYGAAIAPQRYAKLADNRQEIDRLNAARSDLEAVKKPQPAADSQALAMVSLPTVKTTPEALLKLEGIAQEHTLTLRRNDYRYLEPAAVSAGKGASKRSEKNPLVEVRIVMPVSGSYANIRAFVATALNALPTLALDDMSLKRESIAEGTVQAQLRFTLFVRSGL